MSKQKRGLFLLYEGIPSTIFESQVIQHIVEMQEHEYTMDILSYNTERILNSVSKKNLLIFNKKYSSINIYLKTGINIYYPFSRIIHVILLLIFMLRHKGKYGYIHARTNYSGYVAFFVCRLFNIKLLWDCRGDSKSELLDALYNKNKLIKFIGKYYYLPMETVQIKILSQKADSALFVSQALANLFRDLLIIPYKIIPCLVSEKIFYFDKSIREKKRTILGISDKENVFLYSGSMVSYQSLSLQNALYSRVLQFSNSVLIILTSDIDKAKQYFKYDCSNYKGRIIVKKVDFSSIAKYYNAADFAILLRDEKMLNYVASPTKFGEYCLCGLPVIMNDTVEQAYDISRKIHNYISINTISFNKIANIDREKIALDAKSMYSRSKRKFDYIELYKGLFYGKD